MNEQGYQGQKREVKQQRTVYARYVKTKTRERAIDERQQDELRRAKGEEA